jgi:translocation protein SEC66
MLMIKKANAFQEGWGGYIFQSANEMAQNNLLRNRIAEIQSTADSEREWWEKRRAHVETEFMKELDQESNASSDKHGHAFSTGSKGSDDEVVLVETPSSSGGSAGGKKNKKNKK